MGRTLLMGGCVLSLDRKVGNFRRADVQGARIGARIARYRERHYFHPAHRSHRGHDSDWDHGYESKHGWERKN